MSNLVTVTSPSVFKNHMMVLQPSDPFTPSCAGRTSKGNKNLAKVMFQVVRREFMILLNQK
jgi:hypothetical protein